MKSIIRIVLLLIGVLSIGCYEDKGNYDLVDYNKIEEVVLIPSLSNTAVYLGDTVRIAVSMQYKYPDRDTITGFEYVWKRELGRRYAGNVKGVGICTGRGKVVHVLFTC